MGMGDGSQLVLANMEFERPLYELNGRQVFAKVKEPSILLFISQ